MEANGRRRGAQLSWAPPLEVLGSSAEALLLVALSFGVLLRNVHLRNIIRMPIYSEF